MKAIIKKLHEIGAVKFGTFTLKSGIESPIYIDLRLIVSYPKLLKEISEAIWSQVKDCHFDMICGVPYTALPIASVISVTHDVPMIMRRKEIKEYGTKKAIEGAFRPQQKCLIIEDLVTSGSSVLETIEPIEREGINVTDIAVLIDREQGGKERLREKGFKLFSVFTISEILETLTESGTISKDIQEKVLNFIFQTQV